MGDLDDADNSNFCGLRGAFLFSKENRYVVLYLMMSGHRFEELWSALCHDRACAKDCQSSLHPWSAKIK
jgi:hypothetical protein